MCTLSMDRWGRPESGPRRVAATATRHDSPVALVPQSSPLFKSAEPMRRTSSASCGSAHHACQGHRRGCGRRVVLLDAVGRGDHAHGGLRCLEAPLVLVLLRPPEHVPPGDRGAAARHWRRSRPGRLEPPESRRGGRRLPRGGAEAEMEQARWREGGGGDGSGGRDATLRPPPTRNPLFGCMVRRKRRTFPLNPLSFLLFPSDT